jgi:hypothetical protein
MKTSHPVHILRANLETARLKAVEALAAAKGALTSDALQELAILQAALTAVQQEIDTHGVKLGWGAGDELK